MAMELELKHLASYLPFDLQIWDIENEIIRKLVVTNYNISKLEDIGIDEVLLKNESALGFKKRKGNFKLILHPLSDLEKEIEFKGEKFVPMDRIQIYPNAEYLISQISTGFVEIIVYKMLLEWHFDVYGLIDKGLAIDINTLKK
jgi:hypothetical protein